MVEKHAVLKQLQEVVDPEIGMSITEMDLIDDISLEEDGKVSISYHATSAYCPPIFALTISQDIRDKVKKLEDVKDVKVLVTGHFMADDINKRVNPGATQGTA